MIRPAVLVPLLLLLLPACRGGAPAPGPYLDTELVALAAFDRPPFGYLGEDELPRGLEVELVTELVARMGRTVVWRRHPVGELPARLARGEGHLAALSRGVDPEAARELLETRPYFSTDLVVLVRDGSGEPLGLHQLAGLPVAAAPGSHAARVLRQALPESRPILIHAEHELVDRLLGRRIDGIVLDRLAARRLVDQGLPVSILAPRLAHERFTLLLPASRPRLHREVDRHLRDLEREGLLDRLREAYGLDPLTR